MANELCVLAYSGGLDTSALIPYIKETYGYDVIAALVDVGRNRNLPELKERALGAGAVDAVIIDAKEEFVRDFVLPALLANALYEGKYPLVAALSAYRQEDRGLGARAGCPGGGPRLHGQG